VLAAMTILDQVLLQNLLQRIQMIIYCHLLRNLLFLVITWAEVTVILRSQLRALRQSVTQAVAVRSLLIPSTQVI
jgi:hypothetical protein